MGETPTWLADLPAGPNPDSYEPGVCPWQGFDRDMPGEWGHNFDDRLVVTGHAAAKAILGDRRFKQGLHARIARQAPDLDPRFVERRRSAMLGREGPDHIRMRRIASKAAFTPKAANRHRPLMQQIMGELADAIPDHGVCNAVELVHEYPSRVIAQILGTRPDEVTSFASVVETIFGAQRGDPSAVEQAWPAQQQLDARIFELIERKRLEPDEDLITDLIRAEEDEGKLSTQEVHDIAVAVVMAGTETTRNALVRGLQMLAERPHLWRQLVDDEHLIAAVEEILRFAPLAPLRRVVSEELPVGDTVVPQDTVIMINLAAVNRDAQVVDDPHEFRLDRDGRSQHFSLGHGHKFCLGANLAKAEMVEALRVLRDRYAGLELAEPAQWSETGIPRGERVMLKFTD